MSIIDYAIAAFGLAMIVGSAVNAFRIVERERTGRAMRENVKRAGEARGVSAGKDGGG